MEDRESFEKRIDALEGKLRRHQMILRIQIVSLLLLVLTIRSQGLKIQNLYQVISELIENVTAITQFLAQ